MCTTLLKTSRIVERKRKEVPNFRINKDRRVEFITKEEFREELEVRFTLESTPNSTCGGNIVHSVDVNITNTN